MFPCSKLLRIEFQWKDQTLRSHCASFRVDSIWHFPKINFSLTHAHRIPVCSVCLTPTFDSVEVAEWTFCFLFQIDLLFSQHHQDCYCSFLLTVKKCWKKVLSPSVINSSSMGLFSLIVSSDTRSNEIRLTINLSEMFDTFFTLKDWIDYLRFVVGVSHQVGAIKRATACEINGQHY